MEVRVLFILLSLFLQLRGIESSMAMAKPGCQEKCGNISVPYPFGIRAGCYLDKAFEVVCNESQNLSNLYSVEGFQILQLWFNSMNVLIDDRTIGWCQEAADFVDPHLCVHYALNQRFSFSHSANKFVAIGCPFSAFITGVGMPNYTSGCATLCGIPFSGFPFSPLTSAADTCSGFGCCETNFPRDLTSFDMRILKISTLNSSENNVLFATAFLAHKEYPTHKLYQQSDKTKIFPVPVVLNWVIAHVTCHKAREGRNYVCSQNSDCFDSNGQGYHCLCSQGYQGNPYLHNGCQGSVCFFRGCY
ncbi:hypothetical protein RJ640_003644 [Escallonia rubra]|uniref:Wall-associated receptor kinase galacturonan-binding domain-containing protein n=1 Tax=Escallonia rubra TaxID=112253 RepID=A0AA88S8L3_9ASTE|nr:hypothetical protein RJ640_003644 [Escallonia rubra]